MREGGRRPGRVALGRRSPHERSAPLAETFPELAPLLNPPSVAAGGDGDTIQCTAYGWSGTADFDITALSVYRQAVDLAAVERASFVVPGGVSGLPGTSHFADPLELWRTHQRIPMHYTADEVASAARHTLTLAPG